MTHQPLRIAHRGMPRLQRENTLPSFAAALAWAADGIELDVHSTADGKVVVHHDASLSGGCLAICQLTVAELREAAPEVPLLRDVCELVRGNAELFVEIKGVAIEDLVLRELLPYRGPWAIHGFDHEMISRIHLNHPDVRLGVLFEEVDTDVDRVLATSGAMDVWPHYPLVEPSLMECARKRNARVIPWTVNEMSEARRLAQLGVNGLCTDDVRLLTEL